MSTKPPQTLGDFDQAAFAPLLAATAEFEESVGHLITRFRKATSSRNRAVLATILRRLRAATDDVADELAAE